MNESQILLSEPDSAANIEQNQQAPNPQNNPVQEANPNQIELSMNVGDLNRPNQQQQQQQQPNNQLSSNMQAQRDPSQEIRRVRIDDVGSNQLRERLLGERE